MRSARGRKERGPIVLPGGMETGPYRQLPRLALALSPKISAFLPIFPSFQGKSGLKCLKQPELVDLGARLLHLCRCRLEHRLRHLQCLRLLGSTKRQQLRQPREVLA